MEAAVAARRALAARLSWRHWPAQAGLEGQQEAQEGARHLHLAAGAEGRAQFVAQPLCCRAAGLGTGWGLHSRWQQQVVVALLQAAWAAGQAAGCCCPKARPLQLLYWAAEQAQWAAGRAGAVLLRCRHCQCQCQWCCPRRSKIGREPARPGERARTRTRRQTRQRVGPCVETGREEPAARHLHSCLAACWKAAVRLEGEGGAGGGGEGAMAGPGGLLLCGRRRGPGVGDTAIDRCVKFVSHSYLATACAGPRGLTSDHLHHHHAPAGCRTRLGQTQIAAWPPGLLYACN